MSKKNALLALLFICPTILFSQGESVIGTRFANGIAAIVEDKIITVEDIRREIQPYLTQIQEDSKGNPNTFRTMLEQAEDQVIQEQIDNVLIVKKFYEDKAQIPFSFIENQREEEIITRFGGERSKFLQYLKSIGKTPDEYDVMIRDNIIVSVMRGRMRKTQSFISPVKIEGFYVQNKQEFHQKEAIHLRLIRLSQVADEDMDLLRQTSQQIIQELEDGGDFAELAKRHSQDNKKSKGGDWGWKEIDSLIPQLSASVTGLEAGEHSEPVEVGKNIFILYIEEHRADGYVALEDVREQIEELLLSQEAREASERWLERLRRDGYVRRFN